MIQIPPDWKDKTNCEVARLLGCTSQAVLYARRIEAGRCPRCGRKAEPGVQHCKKHRKAVSANNRARKGHKPWKPGGKGRPPIVQEVL